MNYISKPVMAIVECLGVTVVPQNHPWVKEYFNSTSDSITATYFVVLDVIVVKNVIGAVSNPNTACLHEIIHWTGNAKRLARPALTGEDNSDAAIHTEEAAAQIGMFLLARQFGISQNYTSEYLDLYLTGYPLADLKLAHEYATRAVAYIMDIIQSKSPELTFSAAA